MPALVIEGTWEEIERRKAELIGRQLRVSVVRRSSHPAKSTTTNKKTPTVAKPRELVGFGAFKDALPSTEEYMREKREEIASEERSF